MGPGYAAYKRVYYLISSHQSNPPTYRPPALPSLPSVAFNSNSLCHSCIFHHQNPFAPINPTHSPTPQTQHPKVHTTKRKKQKCPTPRAKNTLTPTTPYKRKNDSKSPTPLPAGRMSPPAAKRAAVRAPPKTNNHTHNPNPNHQQQKNQKQQNYSTPPKPHPPPPSTPSNPNSLRSNAHGKIHRRAMWWGGRFTISSLLNYNHESRIRIHNNRILQQRRIRILE